MASGKLHRAFHCGMRKFVTGFDHVHSVDEILAEKRIRLVAIQTPHLRCRLLSNLCQFRRLHDEVEIFSVRLEGCIGGIIFDN